MFRDARDKNFNALLKLEISSYRRNEIIAVLQMEDYSEGPLPDTLYRLSEMWVFGKTEKKKEIYIKISMGVPNNPTICISFHIAERSMNYPFKKTKKMTSPFTGGEAILVREPREYDFRGSKFHIVHHHYQCVDTGETYTDARLDNLNLNQVYNQFPEKPT